MRGRLFTGRIEASCRPQQVGRAAIGGEGVHRAQGEGDAFGCGYQPFGGFGRKGDGARIFLEHDPREGEVPAHILPQRLRAGGGVELVGFLGFGVRDQLVEEFPADEGMDVVNAFAQ